jgi:hypothetical protein
VAYVSIAEVDVDDEPVYVGDVTFVTAHEGEAPYLAEPESVTANAVALVGGGL